MRHKYDDYIGNTYGRLTVISWYRGKNSKAFAVCRCSCNKEDDKSKYVDVCFSHLFNGNTKSCGCLKTETTTKKNKSNTSYHGESNTRLYRCYKSMIYRCCNSKCKDYIHYGGRGIQICDMWKKSFDAFKDWALANGYKEDLTIDRIDVNGNYEPSNCRWISMHDQQYNKRESNYVFNKIIKYNGEEHTLREWSNLVNIPYKVLRIRYLRGWSIDKIFTEPIRHKNVYLEYDGIIDTVNNWAIRFGLPASTFKNRLYTNNKDIYAVVEKYNMRLV